MQNVLLNVIFASSFIRSLKKLNVNLQDEVLEKIEQFKNKENHQKLRVHKLKGNLKEYYSFSVNYKIRILFYWQGDVAVVLMEVGDHDIYV